MRGVRAVVHLAGVVGTYTLEDLFRVNARGLFDVFEAARLAGVERIVFASSNHAFGFYPISEKVSPALPPRPDSLYGVFKVWGETMLREYYDRYGIRSVSLRIGTFRAQPIDQRSLATWLSPADAAHLVDASLRHPDPGCLVVNGYSNNTPPQDLRPQLGDARLPAERRCRGPSRGAARPGRRRRCARPRRMGMAGAWRRVPPPARTVGPVVAPLLSVAGPAGANGRQDTQHDRRISSSRRKISQERRVPSTIPQPVTAPLTRAAMFLVVTMNAEATAEDAVRGLCGDLAGLLRAIGFRDLEGRLSCILGIGADAWDRLFGLPRPRELHPFREIRGVHHAVATPGDLLFHIRATRMDLCFELATLIMSRLGDAIATADEVHGFQYFDDRDLLGFVDGTENPVDQAALDATLIGEEDAAFAGGSYVIVQKYLHDLAAWNAVPVERQEKIVGRTKLSDIELDDATKPAYAHNALTIIEENGVELKIVRANMPFGEVGKGEFGTYFIGYSRTPQRIEQMLENMFVGKPPGNYDRLLDFSRAVTGTLFFVPSATFLEDGAAPASAAAPPAVAPPAVATPEGESAAGSPPPPPAPDGSLGIGSLRNDAGKS